MALVLVIDDEKAMRDLLRRTLEEAGHQVMLATNGREGVQRYRQRRADLIVTDIIMPDQEGVETILALMRDDPQARIIAISGGGRAHYMAPLELAGKHGARRTLEKPFRKTDFLAAVEAVLTESQTPPMGEEEAP